MKRNHLGLLKKCKTKSSNIFEQLANDVWYQIGIFLDIDIPFLMSMSYVSKAFSKLSWERWKRFLKRIHMEVQASHTYQFAKQHAHEIQSLTWSCCYFKILSTMSNLQMLTFQNCKIPPIFPKNVKLITVDNCHGRYFGLDNLSIEILIIRDCRQEYPVRTNYSIVPRKFEDQYKWQADGGISEPPTMFDTFPKLHTLIWENETTGPTNDQRVVNWCKNCHMYSNITKLVLPSVFSISSFPRTNFTKLQYLDLSNWTCLSSIKTLSRMQELQCLLLEGCTFLKKLDGIENLKHLNHLCLTKCHEDLDLSVIPLIQSLLFLQIDSGLRLKYAVSLKITNPNLKFD